MRFKNKFENEVFNNIKDKVNCIHEFKVNDSHEHYIAIKNILDNPNKLRLYKNVPKKYGTNTHTEMVLFGKGLNARVDCKHQNSKGNIQINDIRGQIEKNVIENVLHEDKLIFVYDGKGIDKEEIIKLKQYVLLRNIKNKIELFSLKEFKRFVKKTLNI